MKKKGNIPRIFLLFLGISLLVWLLITFSKVYTSVVTFAISYKNLPQNKVLLQKKQTKTLNILVRGSGFKLLRANFAKHIIVLDVKKATKKSSTGYTFFLKDQRTNLQKQLPSGLQLERLMQEVIYLQVDGLATKKVPVIAHLNIQYQPGYAIDGKLTLTPDSIVVSGARAQIRILTKLHLKKLTLKNIATPFSKKVALVIPKDLQDENFNHRFVNVRANVSEFTEGTLQIPFTVTNIPVGFQINTFPKKIKIIYKVALKNFNKINKNAFTVVCDYQQEQHYLIPKITQKPAFVTSVRIVPDKVTYLIHK